MRTATIIGIKADGTGAMLTPPDIPYNLAREKWISFGNVVPPGFVRVALCMPTKKLKASERSRLLRNL